MEVFVEDVHIADYLRDKLENLWLNFELVV